MTVFEALVLGALQGLTEFLPVSSSGHLVLLQRIFGIEEPVLLFDTMLHAGTLLSVFVVLRRDIWSLLRRIFQPLTALIIIGTVPAVAAALFLRGWLESAFESGGYLGFAFLFTSFALLVSDFLSRRAASRRPEEAATWFDALAVGICQAVALVPGVSRSGLTLSGALSRRLDRDFAARFSFLLSIPAILGALVLQLRDLAVNTGPADAAAGIGAAPMIAGTLSAALVGFFAAQAMLRIVRQRALWGFALYTAVLGTALIFDRYVTGIFF